MRTDLTDEMKSKQVAQYVKYITSKQKVDRFSIFDKAKSVFAPTINDAILKIVDEQSKIEVYSIIMRNNQKNVDYTTFFYRFLSSSENIVKTMRRISNASNGNYSTDMYLFLEKALMDIYRAFPNDIEWNDTDKSRFNRVYKFFQEFNVLAHEFNVAEFSLKNSRCRYLNQ